MERVYIIYIELCVWHVHILHIEFDEMYALYTYWACTWNHNEMTLNLMKYMYCTSRTHAFKYNEHIVYTVDTKLVQWNVYIIYIIYIVYIKLVHWITMKCVYCTYMYIELLHWTW